MVTTLVDKLHKRKSIMNKKQLYVRLFAESIVCISEENTIEQNDNKALKILKKYFPNASCEFKNTYRFYMQEINELHYLSKDLLSCINKYFSKNK